MVGIGPLHSVHAPLYFGAYLPTPAARRDLSHSSKLIVGCWLFAQPMTPALRRHKRRLMRMISLGIRISNHISPLLGSMAFVSARTWHPGYCGETAWSGLRRYRPLSSCCAQL